MEINEAINILKKGLDEAILKNDEKKMALYLNALTEYAKKEGQITNEARKNEIEAEKIRQLDISRENEKQKAINEYNIEMRRLDIEEKKNGIFYKVMTALSVVGELLKGVGSVSQSYADIKTAKLQAKSRNEAIRIITDIEKDGELPYSQANKFIGKF